MQYKRIHTNTDTVTTNNAANWDNALTDDWTTPHFLRNHGNVAADEANHQGNAVARMNLRELIHHT